jgi:hypothetical protein
MGHVHKFQLHQSGFWEDDDEKFWATFYCECGKQKCVQIKNRR